MWGGGSCEVYRLQRPGTRHEGGSWPMARAALDCAVRLDEGCPRLEITPEEKE